MAAPTQPGRVPTPPLAANTHFNYATTHADNATSLRRRDVATDVPSTATLLCSAVAKRLRNKRSLPNDARARPLLHLVQSCQHWRLHRSTNRNRHRLSLRRGLWCHAHGGFGLLRRSHASSTRVPTGGGGGASSGGGPNTGAAAASDFACTAAVISRRLRRLASASSRSTMPPGRTSPQLGATAPIAATAFVGPGNSAAAPAPAAPAGGTAARVSFQVPPCAR